MSEKVNSANAAGVFEPFAAATVPWEGYSQGLRFGTRFQQLGEFGGGTKIGVSIEVLEPGRQACPDHYHMLEEEHVLILEGALSLRLGDRSYPMQAGDYVCFPAGQKVAHALVNTGTQPCRYLLVGDRNPHEVVIYAESGRIGVRLAGAGYRAAAAMDYWEGIATDGAPDHPGA